MTTTEETFSLFCLAEVYKQGKGLLVYYTREKLTMDALDYDQTEVESEQVQEIMAALTASEIESLPDAYMVLRHLRAEKGNVSDAIDATKRTLSWQKEFGVKDIKTCIGHNEELEAILRKENETGKLYVRGHDKDGRAILYMRSAKENTNHETNNMRHLVYHMEKAVACSAAKGRSKICIIVDYTVRFMLKQTQETARVEGKYLNCCLLLLLLLLYLVSHLGIPYETYSSVEHNPLYVGYFAKTLSREIASCIYLQSTICL